MNDAVLLLTGGAQEGYNRTFSWIEHLAKAIRAPAITILWDSKQRDCRVISRSLSGKLEVQFPIYCHILDYFPDVKLRDDFTVDLRVALKMQIVLSKIQTDPNDLVVICCDLETAALIRHLADIWSSRKVDGCVYKEGSPITIPHPMGVAITAQFR